MTQEPVMTLVVALIAAAGALLAAFGVDITDEQIAALSAFAVAAIGLALWVRSRVTPTAKLPAGERGQVQPLTILIYLLVVLILAVLLFALLDRV